MGINEHQALSHVALRSKSKVSSQGVFQGAGWRLAGRRPRRGQAVSMHETSMKALQVDENRCATLRSIEKQ